MSQNAAISLEDLEIKPYLITKLKNAGIQSIFDLAVSIPLDLLELCPGYDCIPLLNAIRDYGCGYDHNNKMLQQDQHPTDERPISSKIKKT